MADDSHNLYFGVIVRICFVIDSGQPNPDLAWPRPASEGAWSGGRHLRWGRSENYHLEYYGP